MLQLRTRAVLESAGVVRKTVLLFWNAEEVVIHFVVQVHVVEDANCVSAGRQLVNVGHGARFDHFDGALSNARCRATFLASVGLESFSIVINRT